MALDWGTIERILSSKATENVMGIAGAGLSAYGQAKEGSANRANNAAQFRAGLHSDQLRDQQAQRTARAVQAGVASPLGENENFASRAAILREILPTLRNPSFRPGDPAVASAMGSMSGGLRLPEGGLSPAALAHLSPEATAAAINRRQGMVSNIDPTAPTVDFAAMGFDPEQQRYTDLGNRYATSRAATEKADDDRIQQMVMRALEQDYLGEQEAKKKKGGGFWSKLGKIAGFALPIAAAPFTGGTSLLGLAGKALNRDGSIHEDLG